MSRVGGLPSDVILAARARFITENGKYILMVGVIISWINQACDVFK